MTLETVIRHGRPDRDLFLHKLGRKPGCYPNDSDTGRIEGKRSHGPKLQAASITKSRHRADNLSEEERRQSSGITKEKENRKAPDEL